MEFKNYNHPFAIYNSTTFAAISIPEYDALYATVDNLEDLLGNERARAEHWRDSASSFYGETLALKLKNRELMEALNKEEYDREVVAANPAYFAIADANNRLQGALKDAEAKIAELHEDNDALKRNLDATKLDRTDTAAYFIGRIDKLKARIKTYRQALNEIARAENGRYPGARLAHHVLTSSIHDGGSDF